MLLGLEALHEAVDLGLGGKLALELGDQGWQSGEHSNSLHGFKVGHQPLVLFLFLWGSRLLLGFPWRRDRTKHIVAHGVVVLLLLVL